MSSARKLPPNPLQQLTSRILHEILDAFSDDHIRKQVVERVLAPYLKSGYAYAMILLGFLVAVVVMISMTFVLTVMLYIKSSAGKAVHSA